MSNEINNKPQIHKGHRQRIKKRFIQSGGNDFSDHELLEMLLYYVIPRSDTNKLAHALLNEFGTLREVLNADPERIKRVMGAGPGTATFFSLLFSIRKRIDTQKYISTKFVADSAVKVGNYLISYFRDMHNEEFCVMLLDNSFRLIEFKTIAKGSNNSAPIDVKAITKFALLMGAAHVILAHNHPLGLSIPSQEDKQITLEVEAALSAVGINLLEHIIVNNTSFRPTLYMRTLGTKNSEHSEIYKKFYDNN